MLTWLKRHPERKLRKQYHAKLTQAMMAQRNGNIRAYASLTSEAEALRVKLENTADKA